MTRILHLLPREPDDMIADLISAIDGSQETRVICLYPDAVCVDTVDWHRVIDDIMAHDTTICWW